MKATFLVHALLFWLCVSPFTYDLPERLLQFIDEEEKIVTQLAGNVTELFKNRRKHIRNCGCSIHSCTNNITGFECTEEFGHDIEFCGPKCEERRIHMNASAFRLPPNTNIKKVNAQLKESVCLYSNLEPVMKELVAGRSHSWIYFGGLDGSHRIFPLLARELILGNKLKGIDRCKPYDPRIRPWFIGASTRAKDIVFVIDVSGSMTESVTTDSEESLWDVTKRALKAMLDTLASFDFVNIVTFSDTAKRLNTIGSLLQGTEENINFLKEQIDVEYPDGQTNFSAGFSEAFDILEKACDEGDETPRCSQCQSVILFLTDGRDTTGPGRKSIETSKLLKNIEKHQKRLERSTSRRASIFTFSLGNTADDSRPRQIACANGGSWSYIGPETDPLTAMSSYYHFLTKSNETSPPVWINPYEDDGGLGNLTTVAKAVFSPGNEDLEGAFLGVAARDVLLEDLKFPGIDPLDVLAELTRRSSSCQATTQSPCQLQVHRNAYADEAICPDRLKTSEKDGNNGERGFSKNCYRDSEKYYVLFTNKVNWDTALETCEKDKGRLVTASDSRELAFIAGIASSDGSWIGARRNLKKGTIDWIDESISNENIQKGSSWWGLGEPNNHDGVEDCVHIDARGANSNLNDESCETELSFICEYFNSSRCDEVIPPPKQGYFTIPPLRKCVHEEERLADIGPLPQSQSLKSKELICPLGKPRDLNERRCCPECLKDNR